MKKVYLKRIIYLSLLIFTFCLIFKFSSQNGSSSKGLSALVMQKIASILPISTQSKEDVAVVCEPILRKIAHFSIYAMVGIWSILLFNTFNIIEKNKIIFSVVIGFIYACTDETHQYFVPNRGATFGDVLLDTIGVCFGVLFILQFIIIKNNKKQNIKIKENRTKYY